MADQGLPLMALPQQNLFGAAGDDLASVLANREIAKRKQMLEDIKAQIEMQKSANETLTAQSGADTAASQRRINEGKAPGQIEELNLKNTDTKNAQAELVKRGEALDAITTVMQNPNATEQEQLAAFSNAVRYGAKLDPEMMKAIGAQNQSHAIGILLDHYNEALKRGDPAEIKAAGLAYMNGGGKGLAPYASEKYAPFGNAGLYRPDTGEVTRQPFAPVAPAGASALTGDQGVNTIQGYKDLLRHGAQISAIPAAARNAVVADMAQKGETFETLTMQGRAMTDLAKSLVPKIDTLKQTWAQIQAMDLTGTIRGRLRQVAAGESLASAMADLTPEQQRLLGKFEGEVSFFTSGTTRAHFQRAGAETYAIMEKNLNPAGASYDTYLGKLDAANEYLSTYANMGGLHEPGETLLTPGAGAGKGGGPGVPSPVDPNNPLGLPRIK